MCIPFTHIPIYGPAHIFKSVIPFFPSLNPTFSTFAPELNGYLNSLQSLEVTLTGVFFHRNGEPDRLGGFPMCSF